jgi:hypothetical protein
MAPAHPTPAEVMETMRDSQPTSRAGVWTKRAGIAAFAFFLGKGLLWLGLGLFVVEGCRS